MYIAITEDLISVKRKIYLKYNKKNIEINHYETYDLNV